ncbi:HN1_G0036650.mRNA.1.CDS.1 [Saccharomyces cerevisiae]|nr:HN1_G0036650.mRNA.1.CDS.1 [Saccharomyces cerevisiae]
MIIIFIELCRIADSLLWIPKSSRRTSSISTYLILLPYQKWNPNNYIRIHTIIRRNPNNYFKIHPFLGRIINIGEYMGFYGSIVLAHIQHTKSYYLGKDRNANSCH